MAPTKITTDATVRMILPKNTTAAKIIAKTMNNIINMDPELRCIALIVPAGLVALF